MSPARTAEGHLYRVVPAGRCWRAYCGACCRYLGGCYHRPMATRDAAVAEGERHVYLVHVEDVARLRRL